MKSITSLLKKTGMILFGVLFGTTVSATTVTFYHNDVSGTPLLSTDASGKLLWKENYRAYGDKLNNDPASSDNRLGFAGKPHDNHTGLSYMGARYYEPLLGRFAGVDPQGFDPENIHSFNRYAYANNNPYKFVDPDGHSPLLVFIPMGIGAVFGGGLNAVMQYYATGSVRWSGAGGVVDAAGDGLLFGLVGGTTAGIRSPSRIPSSSTMELSTAKQGRPDFLVSRDGAVVHNSADKVRSSLENTGMLGRGISNSKGTESGTLHTVPEMKMDVRVMNGGPQHASRVVTNRSGSSQEVNPATGKNFGNVPRLEQRERSHIYFK